MILGVNRYQLARAEWMPGLDRCPVIVMLFCLATYLLLAFLFGAIRLILSLALLLGFRGTGSPGTTAWRRLFSHTDKQAHAFGNTSNQRPPPAMELFSTVSLRSVCGD